MKKITTDQIISISSILASVLVMVFKNELTEDGKIVIYCMFGAIVLGYAAYFLVKFFKTNRSLGSASIINNAKKYVKQLCKLAKTTEAQLKKFDFFKNQKRLEKSNKILIDKYLKKQQYKSDENSKSYLRQKENLTREIAEYTRIRSENYSDLDALKAYNGIYKVMSPYDLENNFEISQNLVRRIFDMNRILLQLEQHNYRIKLGHFVARYASKEEDQIKAYMDLIGWSHILLGSKKGYEAVNNAINIIESRIGAKLSPKAPEGMDQDFYEHYLLLKARAYRHLGSTYYTYRHVDAEHFCNKSLEVLATLEQAGFHERHKADFENMEFGVKNNYYLHQLYKFISQSRKGHADVNDLNKTLEAVNRAIDGLSALPKEKQDQHRMLKLLSLKCQINKAVSVVTAESMDIKESEQNLKIIESTLSKNIYFDDAMEVYSNQKVQLVFEETKNIIIGNRFQSDRRLK